ncbi:MAG: TIGR02217 family protein [Burkholderiaceae bacterium]|nr:TIGR02217 family protein [Burkholderiaceae bacterium]
MDFHELQFPPKISYGAVGGPAFKTTVYTRANGAEDRNIEWSRPRYEYDVAYGVKSQKELDQVLAFFYARLGRKHGFRFKDWTDYKSCPATKKPAATDQVIGTGDGTKTTFQLTKAYSSGGVDFVRQIKKPVAGTVRIAINGTEQGNGWSADTTTGVVTFASAPGSGAVLTAGYEFDVPVRFDTDECMTMIDDYNAHTWGQIPLVEVRM